MTLEQNVNFPSTISMHAYVSCNVSYDALTAVHRQKTELGRRLSCRVIHSGDG